MFGIKLSTFLTFVESPLRLTTKSKSGNKNVQTLKISQHAILEVLG